MSDLVTKLRNPSFPPESRLQDDARELMQRCFEAANRIEALEVEVQRLRKALKPFASLFASPEMGIHEHDGRGDKTLTIAGEGGHLRPKFNLYAALRRARAAMEPTNE